jgi:hypothetical protein
MRPTVLLLAAAGAAATGNLRTGTLYESPLGIAKDCGAGKSDITWSSLTMNPDPPVRGQPLLMTATGTSKNVRGALRF